MCQIISGSIKLGNKKKERLESNSTNHEIILLILGKCKILQFEGEDMKLEGKILDQEFKPTWKHVREWFKKGGGEKRLEKGRKKEMQSETSKNEKKNKKCSIWLEQNLLPRKVSLMSMIEQMIETRVWKEAKELTEKSQCILCKEQRETVQYLLAGCKMLASS